jgi:hypothetical protein
VLEDDGEGDGKGDFVSDQANKPMKVASNAVAIARATKSVRDVGILTIVM